MEVVPSGAAPKSILTISDRLRDAPFVDFGVPSMGGCKEGERLTDREPMDEAVERE